MCVCARTLVSREMWQQVSGLYATQLEGSGSQRCVGGFLSGFPGPACRGRDAVFGIGLSPSGVPSGWRETEGRQWEPQEFGEGENKSRKTHTHTQSQE